MKISCEACPFGDYLQGAPDHITTRYMELEDMTARAVDAAVNLYAPSKTRLNDEDGDLRDKLTNGTIKAVQFKDKVSVLVDGAIATLHESDCEIPHNEPQDGRCPKVLAITALNSAVNSLSVNLD
jgi:hypothetical protein